MFVNGREVTQKRLVTLWNLTRARAIAHTLLGAAALHGGCGCSGGVRRGGLQVQKVCEGSNGGGAPGKPRDVHICSAVEGLVE